METEMEDGVYLAVSCYVPVVFCLFFLGWSDALCLYAAYKGGSVGHGLRCKAFLTCSPWTGVFCCLLGNLGRGGLLGHWRSRGGHLYVCVVLDLSLRRSRSRVWTFSRAGDGR